MLLISLFILLLLIQYHHSKPQKSYCTKPKPTQPNTHKNHPKPQWVIDKIIYLKAIMGKQVGCRKIANTFNRLYKSETVGKTFVANTIQKYQYKIQQQRYRIKQKLPLEVAINHTWAMDLSFYSSQMLLGILDHGSRKLLHLQPIQNKSSWALLGYLCLTIAKYGKPKKLRTDNEIIFNSFVFKTFLKLVNIKKQTTPVASPWCNGRIERLFGTLKPIIKTHYIESYFTLNSFLTQFKYWYNNQRTHQNLNRRTPNDIWYQNNKNRRK